MEGGGSGGQRERWRWSDGGRDGVRGGKGVMEGGRSHGK